MLHVSVYDTGTQLSSPTQHPTDRWTGNAHNQHRIGPADEVVERSGSQTGLEGI